ncbi:hypothetical protein AB6F89_22045 [Providencia hangzhouensis]|uniref:hypothetical protein n=1 Tax=Providencia hangzhouensis TaxID=3031799 RepID=UPI0034DCC70E
MKSNTTVDWETQPAILVNPLKKKKFEKHLIFIMVGIGLCVGLYLWMDKSINKAIALYENDNIKPEMTTKANEGKVPALLWIAAHYPDAQTLDELDTLIAQDNAEAMVLKAQLVYPTDNVLALSLINQAAQEGHPASVRYLSDKKNRDISVTAFLKQYVFEGD